MTTGRLYRLARGRVLRELNVIAPPDFLCSLRHIVGVVGHHDVQGVNLGDLPLKRTGPVNGALILDYRNHHERIYNDFGYFPSADLIPQLVRKAREENLAAAFNERHAHELFMPRTVMIDAERITGVKRVIVEQVVFID